MSGLILVSQRLLRGALPACREVPFYFDEQGRLVSFRPTGTRYHGQGRRFTEEMNGRTTAEQMLAPEGKGSEAQAGVAVAARWEPGCVGDEGRVVAGRARRVNMMTRTLSLALASAPVASSRSAMAFRPWSLP